VILPTKSWYWVDRFDSDSQPLSKLSFIFKVKAAIEKSQKPAESSFTRLDWVLWLANDTTLSEVVMNLDRELVEWLFSWRGSNCIDHIRSTR
jgi:hypothetical protein